MKIEIDGVTYRPDGVPAGNRVVLVVDRGWIFAGNESIGGDGTSTLADAVHVFGWESIGFAKAVEDWRSDKVDIRGMAYPVEVPAGSIIFRVPVEEEWGKK